jgi:hypothetical protein
MLTEKKKKGRRRREKTFRNFRFFGPFLGSGQLYIHALMDVRGPSQDACAFEKFLQHTCVYNERRRTIKCQPFWRVLLRFVCPCCIQLGFLPSDSFADARNNQP